MNQTLTPETAAFAMLVASWQRRFIARWTVTEIADWRARFVTAAKRGA